MERRLAFAFARVRPLRVRVAVPSVSLPSLRAPSFRELAVTAAVLVVLAVGYAVARVTPLFAVKTITVSGAPADIARGVRASLDDVAGSSLVALDTDEVERRVVALPAVRAAHVDRAFPDEVAVVVKAERPLAVLRQGRQAWLIAESGAVIREIKLGDLAGLPRLRLAESVALRTGGVLAGRDGTAALDLLRARPRRFPVRIHSVRSVEGVLAAVVGASVELRLGPPVDLEAKLGAAAAVFRSLPEEERRGLAYVDVALPQRPVAAARAQLVSES